MLDKKILGGYTMKPTKKMNKMWAIIIVILGTLIMPFKVAGNTNQAPTITFGQMGGEVLKQSDGFITNSNPKGYGTVPVTATDPEGDGVERFEYMWDWYILDTVEIVKPRWTTMKPTRTYAVQVPQQPGLHTLRIRAIDEHGNASDWIAVPYYIVDKLSATPDTTGPVIDTNSLPAEGTALELGSTVSIKASDAESGVYYIAYAWKKAGTGTPSSSEYTRVFQPVNGTVKDVQVPTTIGKWTLYTFGGNSTYNQQTELFITGSKYTPTYEIVNTSELKESIKTVENAKYEQANYTTNSWNTYAAALNTAKTVADSSTRTQVQINDAKATLESAVNGLVDISALKASIKTAEDANYQQENYSTDSWNFYKTALEVAKTVVASEDATQTQVDGARIGLEEAVKGLTTDKTELQAAITEADKLKAANFTEGSFSIFTNALNTAKSVAGNANATQLEINNAKIALEEAVNGLVDISALKASLETAGTKVQEEYSTASWEAFITKKEAAQEVLDNASATKEQVAEAKTELDNAMSNLTVDKTALTDILAEANGKVAENFTQTSYEALTQAKVGAEDLTKQSEIDSKVAEIRKKQQKQ